MSLFNYNDGIILTSLINYTLNVCHGSDYLIIIHFDLIIPLYKEGMTLTSLYIYTTRDECMAWTSIINVYHECVAFISFPNYTKRI